MESAFGHAVEITLGRLPRLRLGTFPLERNPPLDCDAICVLFDRATDEERAQTKRRDVFCAFDIGLTTRNSFQYQTRRLERTGPRTDYSELLGSQTCPKFSFTKGPSQIHYR
jgi:hypothetical protein